MNITEKFEQLWSKRFDLSLSDKEYNMLVMLSKYPARIKDE